MLLVGMLWSAGCSDPELEKRVSDLETKVAELQKKGGLVGAPGVAPTANSEEERAAGALLKDATAALEKGDFDTAKAKVGELVEKYPSTRAAKAAGRIRDELAVVGNAEVPLQVERWYQGSEADVAKGKAKLYVFWEVWCPHCRREVPRLADTYNKYHPQGLAMVGLTKQTRDVSDQQVTDFITENKLPYPIAKEEGDAMSKAYGVQGIPAAAIVKDGKVVWRGHPGKLTDEMIQNFLGS
jgi:peroxiredoxin